MKTILVALGGGASDQAVLATAVGAARLLAAHLEVFHVRVGAAEAARYTPHVAFARGAGLHDAITRLHDASDHRASAALADFRAFCASETIPIVNAPCVIDGPSASWCSEAGDAEGRLMLRARHNDLLVMARASAANGLPGDLLETLLVGSGRPILIPPAKAPDRSARRIMVCWKEAGEAARALTAALPLLKTAERVDFVTIAEEGGTSAEALADIARQMAWHGIKAEAERIPNDGRAIGAQLAAHAASCGAGLMVMGAFGSSRTRQLIFGGCTRMVLDDAELPVFLIH